MTNTISKLRRLVNGDPFNLAIAGVIVANAVTLGLGTYPGMAHNGTLNTLNNLFYAVFVVELVMRIASYGSKPWQFYRNGWNVFDFITITAALIPFASGSAQALRLVRLARIARLVRFVPDVKVLTASVVKSLPSLGSLVVLTFLLVFVYGMLGWTLFGEQLPHDWGNLTTAMLTLFVLLTLENFPVYLNEAAAVSPWGVAFFISYALLAAFIIFNLLIGIIVDSLEKARDEACCGNANEPQTPVAETIAALRDALDALESQLPKAVDTRVPEGAGRGR